ncbi:pectate lyase [Prosthecomicrobium pneumaticum]|uniref:Glycosyltransferase RgtA/B/C/D-like domain-containing protein n=1 Tax=Prosthecomicrobium pneumaticum TaxID=81895 RepID=A0A7W9FPG2_9HYPH|nr:pectate lyase [Prosthecomicrobium pneumaticum]MBB5754474.1 hypothetical protein [Prosthecomicrobium pneumaticum]
MPLITRRAARHLAPLVPGLLLVLLVSAPGTWWRVLDYNVDEGFNLGKAALYNAGFDLYRDVWNDQPPILTVLLAALQRVFPDSVAAGRTLVLVMAVLLLAALFRVTRRLQGSGVAWIATLLLASAALFQDLAVSVMIGLPAIALTVVALDLLTRRSIRPWRDGLVAGGIYAVALHTKLFVLPILPALALAAWIAAAGEGRRARLATFLAATGAVYGLIALILDIPIGGALVGPHVTPALRATYSFAANLRQFVRGLSDVALLMLVALAACAWIVARRRGGADWIPVLWLLPAFLVLVLHTPLWTHQFLLLVVPGTWCAAILLDAARQELRTAPPRVKGVSAALALAGLVHIVVVQVETWRGGARAALAASVDTEAIRRLWRAGDWTYCDRAIDCFRVGALVPPETVVNSGKRVTAGNLPEDLLIRMLERRAPAQLVFRNGIVEPALRSALRPGYVALADMAGIEHFVRRDRLLQTAPPVDLPAAIGALEGMTTALEAAMGGTVLGGVADADGVRTERDRAPRPLGPGQVVARPPHAAPKAGACLLAVGTRAGNAALSAAALRTARAVACAQLPGGGWARVFGSPGCAAGGPPAVPPPKLPRASLDEGAPADAIAFLLDATAIAAPDDRVLFEAAARRGLDFYVAAQAPSGGWPQMVPPSEEKFERHLTLNDGVTTKAIAILLRGWRVFGDERYRAAAEAGGDFLIRGQDPATGAFAQQYDETLAPAPARAFEPAAHASLETGLAVLALADLYGATGEGRFLAPLGKARDWLLGRQIAPGVWSRLYAIEDDRPIYIGRDGRVKHALRDIPLERRTGYRWQGAFPEVERALGVAAAAGGGTAAIEAVRRDFEAGRRADDALVARMRLSALPSGEGGVVAGRLATADLIDACEAVRTLLRSDLRSASDP